MKKSLLLGITVICCIAITACGTDEVKKDSNITNDVKIESTEISIVESIETQELNVEEAVVQEETIDVIVEEPIGDVDIASDELSMDDMQELVVGLDIPIQVRDTDSDTSFKEFFLLFPSATYITDYAENGVRANLDKIDFDIVIFSANSTPSNVIREERGETQETIGNFLLGILPIRNSEYGFQKVYSIYDTANGTLLNITLTINKESDYREYGDAIIEQFVPAFEETLRNNLE